MNHRDEMPEEVEGTAAWLRAQRPEVSAQDLDRLKMRARAQAEAAGTAIRAPTRPRRTLATVLAAVALTVGLGGAFALAAGARRSWPGSPSSHGSAAHHQYKPGKGCGDKNHQHECEGFCGKPPKAPTATTSTATSGRARSTRAQVGRKLEAREAPCQFVGAALPEPGAVSLETRHRVFREDVERVELVGAVELRTRIESGRATGERQPVMEAPVIRVTVDRLVHVADRPPRAAAPNCAVAKQLVGLRAGAQR